MELVKHVAVRAVVCWIYFFFFIGEKYQLDQMGMSGRDYCHSLVCIFCFICLLAHCVFCASVWCAVCVQMCVRMYTFLHVD